MSEFDPHIVNVDKDFITNLDHPIIMKANCLIRHWSDINYACKK